MRMKIHREKIKTKRAARKAASAPKKVKHAKTLKKATHKNNAKTLKHDEKKSKK